MERHAGVSRSILTVHQRRQRRESQAPQEHDRNTIHTINLSTHVFSHVFPFFMFLYLLRIFTSCFWHFFPSLFSFFLFFLFLHVFSIFFTCPMFFDFSCLSFSHFSSVVLSCSTFFHFSPTFNFCLFFFAFFWLLFGVTPPLAGSKNRFSTTKSPKSYKLLALFSPVFRSFSFCILGTFVYFFHLFSFDFNMTFCFLTTMTT